MLIFLWTVFYLIVAFGLYGQLLIEHLGLMLFLALGFSYLVLCGLAFLLALTAGLTFLRRYANYEDYPARLAGILPPLAFMGICIGAWDILFVALSGPLFIS